MAGTLWRGLSRARKQVVANGVVDASGELPRVSSYGGGAGMHPSDKPIPPPGKPCGYAPRSQSPLGPPSKKPGWESCGPAVTPAPSYDSLLQIQRNAGARIGMLSEVVAKGLPHEGALAGFLGSALLAGATLALDRLGFRFGGVCRQGRNHRVVRQSAEVPASTIRVC